MTAAILAVVSALGYGAGDFIGGRSSTKTPEMVVIAASQLVGLVMVLAMAVVMGGEPTPADLFFGGLGGQFGFMGLVFLYRGIARGQAVVVAPISAIVAALLPVIVGLITGSRPGIWAWIGVGLAFPAVALVSGVARIRSGAVTTEAILFGVAAGVGFGLLFTAYAQTSIDSGVWPLVASRVASIVVLGIIIGVRSLATDGVRDIVGPIFWIGVLDMAGNLGFTLAAQRGDLVLVTMLTALYPAVTVVLARVVDNNLITRPQGIGLGLAVIAAGLLGLG